MVNIVRTYKKGDGTEGKIRGIKVLEQYADEETAVAAKAANDGNVPDGSSLPKENRKVEALPLAQALGFVETLARQALKPAGQINQTELTIAFEAMPMLAELNVNLPEVQKIINAIEQDMPF